MEKLWEGTESKRNEDDSRKIGGEHCVEKAPRILAIIRT